MVIDSARALKLTQQEVHFMKNTSMDPAASEINSASEQQCESKGRTTAPFQTDIKAQPARNKSTVEVCRYCGQQTPHRGKCKARGATCNKRKKKGHFAFVCQSKPAKTVRSIEQDHSQSGGDDDPQTPYNFNQVTWKLDQVSTNAPTPTARTLTKRDRAKDC